MKRFAFVFLGCFVAFSVATAQADHKLDDQTLQTDKTIMADIIRPALGAGQEPDWKILRTTIVAKYGDTYADRNVTKARIFYFYGKDWAQFSTALVQYTQNYEFRDSLSLMNKNAKMVLEHSDNPADWKAAQGWVKYAADKNPSNEEYKATLEALGAKIGGR
jgi:hypothetical protein